MLTKNLKNLGKFNLCIALIWAACFSLNMYSGMEKGFDIWTTLTVVANIVCVSIYTFTGFNYLSKFKKEYNLEKEKSLIELTEKLKLHQSEQSINS